MIKIPYGISNFETLVRKGQHYVDRTQYIEELEGFFSSYLFFVRPRRFGKSLFLSVLEYYYGIQYKDQFETLFGQYYIGQHPTPLANQYLILKFDFSRIDTSSFDNTYRSFLNTVKEDTMTFLGLYPQFFSEKDIEKVEGIQFPGGVMQYLLRLTRIKAKSHKIYLLVDEYDHFANEILSFRFKEFSKIVGENGFIRKFYEAIKVGTQSGVIENLFITGVSPLTLDSLTSGFNIATNISLDADFNAMMGFKEEEVVDILKGIDVPKEELSDTLQIMKEWYDGYNFAVETTERIYNSDMVLYFASHYSRHKQFPRTLLDPNIASDYTKIQRLFEIKNKEEEHFMYLEELLTTGTISARLVRQCNIETPFERDTFVSLLYYVGILTIERQDFAEFIFRMPNYTIRQLFSKILYLPNYQNYYEK